VRGAVEVRSVILKRLVRLSDVKHIAQAALVAPLITSNHLRSE
jgi:hypothetical protein